MGCVSPASCRSTTKFFFPSEYLEHHFRVAVEKCLKRSPVGDCSAPISEWDVSRVTDMHSVFLRDAEYFNQDLSRWDVGKVTNMEMMFFRAMAFNSELSEWDVAQVTNMQGMFYQASAFNQDLSKWDVSK